MVDVVIARASSVYDACFPVSTQRARAPNARVLADTVPPQEVGAYLSLWPVSEIAVDSAGLPVLLVNAVVPKVAGHWYDTGLVLRCNRARCGAG